MNAGFTLQIPADIREAKIAILLELAQETTGVKAHVEDNSKPIACDVESGGQGLWHWVVTDLKPGNHRLRFLLHFPASVPRGARISGWLLARRSLASKSLRLTLKPNTKAVLPPENLLPASSQIQRATYALFEQAMY